MPPCASQGPEHWRRHPHLQRAPQGLHHLRAQRQRHRGAGRRLRARPRPPRTLGLALGGVRRLRRRCHPWERDVPPRASPRHPRLPACLVQRCLLFTCRQYSLPVFLCCITETLLVARPFGAPSARCVPTARATRDMSEHSERHRSQAAAYRRGSGISLLKERAGAMQCSGKTGLECCCCCCCCAGFVRWQARRAGPSGPPQARRR